MPGTECKEKVVWDLAHILQPSQPYAMLILNHSINPSTIENIKQLWCNACVRVCVDGGTNDYYTLLCGGSAPPLPALTSSELQTKTQDSHITHALSQHDNNAQNGSSRSSTNGSVISISASPATLSTTNSQSSVTERNMKLYPEHSTIPLPDFISGDFDSIKSEVLQHYTDIGVQICPTPDQNETDFTKSLRALNTYLSANPEKKPTLVLVSASVSEYRFDHVLANINTLHKSPSLIPLPLVLVTGSSLQFLLHSGRHTVMPPGHTDPDDNWCGYAPCAGPTTITTKGLKWDVCDRVAQFGYLVSTSNQFTKEAAVISTDGPLLFVANGPPTSS